MALKSLSYSLKERKKALNLIKTKLENKVINSITFEILLKESLDFLDKSK